MGDEKSNDLVPGEQNIRHDMVKTAVNFLLNPAVINKPDVHKTAFLKKKGLTDEEISLAYEQAESDRKQNDSLRNSIASKTLPFSPPPPVPVYREPPSFWTQISRFSSSLIVLGVALFGAHHVYKTYLEPLIFGEDSERKKSDKQLLEMANSLSQLERHVLSLEESIKHQKGQMDKFFQNELNEYYATPMALRELKTEIAAVKSLLLNRHQFPALPKVTPVIPHWQLPPKENEGDAIQLNGDTSKIEHSEALIDSKSSCEINSEENEDISRQMNGREVTKIEELVSLQGEH